MQEDTDRHLVMHEAKTVVGGMITVVTVKTTKKNQMMAFLTLEDVYGTVEIMVFPRDYEKYRSQFVVDKKVFIVGKVAVEEDRPAKVILQKIVAFDQLPRQVWFQFTNKDEYEKEKGKLEALLEENPGEAEVVVYCKEERARKSYGNQKKISTQNQVLEKLVEIYKEENVKVVEKSVEKL